MVWLTTTMSEKHFWIRHGTEDFLGSQMRTGAV